jgi:hypothetical protein
MFMRSLTVSAGALMIVFSAHISAQTPPDPGAASNVKESQHYEQMLQNPAFRAKRMRTECGPITDPELNSNCRASFGGQAHTATVPGKPIPKKPGEDGSSYGGQPNTPARKPGEPPQEVR